MDRIGCILIASAFAAPCDRFLAALLKILSASIGWRERVKIATFGIDGVRANPN